MKEILFFITLTILSGCDRNTKPISIESSNEVPYYIVEIDSFLKVQEEKDSLHGVVLIADRDVILLRKSFGFFDVQKTKPHKVDGKIGLASMPKMFTALAVMQLESQGKINIELPVGNYLPALQNSFWGDSITAKELLSHTSGLGFYWDYTNDSVNYSLSDLVELILEKEGIPSERGKFAYSNNGFIVLG